MSQLLQNLYFFSKSLFHYDGFSALCLTGNLLYLGAYLMFLFTFWITYFYDSANPILLRTLSKILLIMRTLFFPVWENQSSRFGEAKIQNREMA